MPKRRSPRSGRKRSHSRSRSRRRSPAACVPTRRTAPVPRLQTRRRSLPRGAFALPEKRSYPIPDAYHATLALTYLLRTVARHGPRSEDAKKVLSAIRHFYPDVYDCEFDLVSRIKAENKIRTIPAYRGETRKKFRRASRSLKRRVSTGRVRKVFKRRSRSRSRSRR